MQKSLINDINIYWVEKCIYPENNAIENHSHDFFHFLCVISGLGEITCNDSVYKMQNNKVFIARPNDIHGFKNISKEDLITYEVKMDINNNSLKTKLTELSFCININQQITDLFSSMYSESKGKKPFSNEITTAFAVQMLYSILRGKYELLTDNEKYPSIELKDSFSRILLYLDRNMSYDITLDDMAKAMYLEKVYFLKKFKKLTDMTPMRYLKAMRMKKAKTLLQYSDMSITLVAESVGFKNIQYFSKVFTEYNKINPSSYRSKFMTAR